ncbi:hypothetical protein V0M98_33410 (plasmid) [Pseudomonas silesiensis]|uniref:hypothetical protein n=1 Tax=Pseudomonas silesiensis TaxID=1853130 RepID=UPI0030CA7FE3
MKVKGIEVTDAQISAMIDAMASHFRASDVEAAAIKAGVPDADMIALRAADRLIQQRRKKGLIKIVGKGPYWTNQ